MSPEFNHPASIIVEQERRRNPRFDIASKIYQTFMRRYTADVLHPGMAQEQAKQLQDMIASGLKLPKSREIRIMQSARLLHHLRREDSRTILLRGGINEAEAFSTAFLLRMIKQQEDLLLPIFRLDDEAISATVAATLIEVAQASATDDVPPLETLLQPSKPRSLFLFIASASEFWQSPKVPQLNEFGISIMKENQKQIDFPSGFFS